MTYTVSSGTLNPSIPIPYHTTSYSTGSNHDLALSIERRDLTEFRTVIHLGRGTVYRDRSQFLGTHIVGYLVYIRTV